MGRRISVAITLLMAHMFLEAKTTGLIDSLEIAALKFLNAVTERAPAEGGKAPPATAAGRVPAPATSPATARGLA